MPYFRRNHLWVCVMAAWLPTTHKWRSDALIARYIGGHYIDSAHFGG